MRKTKKSYFDSPSTKKITDNKTRRIVVPLFTKKGVKKWKDYS